jgi:hypothetical protein
MSDSRIYKILFHSQDKIYEIYARHVNQGHILGFIEVEKLVFGEKTTVLVDPSEENLKTEFAGVVRTYLPMHSVIRIDEVEKEGRGKITPASSGEGKIHHLPVYTPPQAPKK